MSIVPSTPEAAEGPTAALATATASATRADDDPSTVPATPAPWGGIWVALVTPFVEGKPDIPALGALVQRLCDDGAHGFVVGGTTGEAAVLSIDERKAILEATLAKAGGRPVMMGAGGTGAADVLADMAPWRDLPLAACLVSAPAYVRPSAQALQRHFETVADAAPHPLFIYDIPYRTGAVLPLPTLRALAAHPRICGIKDCGGDAAKTRALIADGQLAVLTGEDAQVFSSLCLGGAGAISAAAHVHLRAWRRLYDAVQRQELLTARRLHHALAPLVEALFAEPNPAPVKALLAQLGEMSADVRPPLLPASPPAAQRAWLAWQAVERQLDVPC